VSTYQKIFNYGLLVFILTLCAKILALVKDMILAYKFGQGELTDAYFIAYSIPHTLMFIMGITLLKGMSSSIFSESIAQKRHEHISTLFSTIFNGAFLFTVIISLFGIWQMPFIINHLPFSYSAVTNDTVIRLGRILFPLIILLGLSDFLGAVLNAFRSFFLPGFSLVIANTCMILSLLLLSDRLSITSLAYGTVVGFFAACIMQFIYIITRKIKYKPFSANLQPVKSYVLKSLPLLLVTGMGQVSVLIGYIIALSIESGMVSALSYAGKINELSLHLFILPLLTVLLPEFARNKAVDNIQTLKSNIRFGAETIGAIIVFWTAFIIVFHKEVIIILFQRGEFTTSNAALTGEILLIYIIGMCFQAGYMFFVFVFLGLQKTKTLALIGVLSYTVNIILMFLLSRWFNVYGIAWAATITSVIYFLLLLYAFKRRCIQFSLIKHGKNLFKIVCSGISVLIFFRLLYTLIYFDTEKITTVILPQLLIVGVIGIILYMGLLHLLGIFAFGKTVKGLKRSIFGQN